MYGPTLPISEEIHQMKYRTEGETFRDSMSRIANALKDDEQHFNRVRDILLEMKFLPGGRVQAAMGAPKQVTAYNCFVSETIPDSMKGIMSSLGNAAQTMRMGGGIGYDCSTLRPRGFGISTLGTPSSGPLSFFNIHDAMCKTIASAGHRRGAQMLVMRVDHPDIELFIKSKNNENKFKTLNFSVGITNEFMRAVVKSTSFNLKFEDKIVTTIDARNLWNKIMRNTWDWAEPGVLFIDTINEQNNLYYCETIAATNPCGEQPLPPHGACLLGSFNLTRYICFNGGVSFDWTSFGNDIEPIVIAMDNVIDRTIYPLKEQEIEAKNKRRMGLGITGLGNVLAVLGIEYGSEESQRWLEKCLKLLANKAYMSSSKIARKKGSFSMLSRRYFESAFFGKLDENVQHHIQTWGIRNSHLTSIAPTGTISLTANNISSSIEPAFSKGFSRKIQTYEGPRTEHVEDYAWREWGVECKYADDCTINDHLVMLTTSQYWVDSSVSKTCNVGSDVSFEEFKQVYMDAWKQGAKGCTTFRKNGKRYGILNTNEEGTQEPTACYISPDTGKKTCE